MVEGTCREDTSCATQKNAAESTPIEDTLCIVAVLACPSALLRLLEAKGTPLEVLSIVVVVVPKESRFTLVRCQTSRVSRQPISFSPALRSFLLLLAACS